MKTKSLLTLILFVATAINIKAQKISCSSFFITDIQMSTIPNTMSVTIYFEADSNAVHINYPYISVITDMNGHKIATGQPNDYLQRANTSHIFNVTTSLTSIPAGFHCTAYFNHDKSVCALPYPPNITTSVSCSDFCATDIKIDSFGLSASLFINSRDKAFISYPYISAITNTNGDTVARGRVSTYGQFGNTTKIYQLSTTLSSVPANFNGTLHFHYRSQEHDNSQKCMLPYPCVPLNHKKEE